jgi:hypothetical protein
LSHVFIAATAQVHDHDLIHWQFGGQIDRGGDGVARFEGGNDPFEAREFGKRGEGLFVGGVSVLDTVLVPEPGVFGTDRGVVEAGADAVGELDLAIFILEDVRARALQHAEGTALKTGGVLFGHDAFAAGFNAKHFDGRVFEKWIKQANGVRTAADAGDKMVGQAFFFFENLAAGFVADNALEISDHHRVGMRAVRGAQNVMSGADIGDPIAHGFVDRFLKRFLAGMNGDDFGAQHAHAKDIQFLARAIHRAHIDDAFEAEHGADGGGGDAVLAGAGFGDDAGLAHAPREQNLADGVVDFVRAGVEEVFALKINFRAAELARETLGEVERGGASAEFAEIIGKFALKFRIFLRAEIFRFQLLQRMHERLRHVTAAVLTEVTVRIGKVQFSFSNAAHSAQCKLDPLCS